MTKLKKYKIPFSKKDGSMPMYSWYIDADYELKDVYEFTALLKYETYYTGRSSTTFVLSDEKGIKYTMMTSDFHEMLKAGKQLAEGWYGTFTFIKRSTSYGIQLVK